MTNLKKKTDGFTIIEVMIVLVIAAVILLIVFLAVPALQRNSRNNQRKNDASRISSAMAEDASNSNGELATTYADISGYIGDFAFYTIPAGGISAATLGQTVADENTIAVAADAI